MTGLTIGGFYDGFAEIGTIKQDHRVIRKLEKMENDFKILIDSLVIGIVYKHMAFRKAVFEKHFGKIPFSNIIRPYSFIDSTSHLEKGIVI